MIVTCITHVWNGNFSGFFIFSKFWFSRMLRGQMCKKGPKWQKILSFIVQMCKMIANPGFFFPFFKIFIFWVVGVVKGRKIVQNDKTLCPSRSISHEPYIIWLAFMVHMCKMIISPGVFSIFFKSFIFQVVTVGVKVQKGCKMTKNIVRCTPYLRNDRSFDCHLLYTCVKW